MRLARHRAFVEEAIVARIPTGHHPWNPAAERLFGFTAQEGDRSVDQDDRAPGPPGEEDDVLRRLRRGNHRAPGDRTPPE